MNHDHSATGYSPFYLAYGYHPRTLSTVSYTNCHKESANSPAVNMKPGPVSQIGKGSCEIVFFIHAQKSYNPLTVRTLLVLPP